MDLTDQLSAIDGHIRAGDIEKALSSLKKIRPQRIKDAAAPRFAQLCWRAGQPEIGARRLYRVVRDTAGKLNTSRSNAIAEYAMCLMRLGAVGEAAALLGQIQDSKNPRRLFYRAAALISEWRHAEAIPFLRAYGKTRSLSRYDRLVAHLNLAAAFIATEQPKKAGPLLKQVTFHSSLAGNQLLLMRSLELTAEMYFVEKDFKRAEQFLQASERRRKSELGLDALAMAKFRGALNLMSQPKAKLTVDEISSVRKRAFEAQHWETVRDCDRIQAVATHDIDLSRKVFFGTPYPSYRATLIEAIGAQHFSLQNPYDWTPLGKPGPDAGLDVMTGRQFDGTRLLEPGSLLHRFLVLLSSDFYRPHRAAAIYSKLNPGSFFNPDLSPDVVHNLAGRLRSFLKQKSLPLELAEKNGFYSLTFLAPFTLRIRRSTILGRRYSEDFAVLSQAFFNQPFTLDEAICKLRKPRRTVQRLLADFVEQRLVLRTGARKSIRYQAVMIPNEN